jgi:16S rRNA (guanine(527)-N(7))-methyltransferase RsmG
MERWNQRINLTGLHGTELARRLVSEPVWIGRQLGMAGSLIDVGSGNGCPAISLCVTRPLREAHLIEARGKRAAFLRHIRTELQLSAMSVHGNRFEDVASTLGKADWITLQAVALSKPLLHGLRLVSTDTTRIVWITAGKTAPSPSSTRMAVPGSSTEAWLLKGIEAIA